MVNLITRIKIAALVVVVMFGLSMFILSFGTMATNLIFNTFEYKSLILLVPSFSGLFLLFLGMDYLNRMTGGRE